MLGNLGAGSGHYTAVVMYDDKCEPKRNRDVNPEELYAYIDSMDVDSKGNKCKLKTQCYTKDELLLKVQSFNPTSMIFVFAEEKDVDGNLTNVYNSVSLQRMTARAAEKGGEAGWAGVNAWKLLAEEEAASCLLYTSDAADE